MAILNQKLEHYQDQINQSLSNLLTPHFTTTNIIHIPHAHDTATGNGDIFAAYALNGHTVILTADVSGHGAAASPVATYMQSIFPQVYTTYQSRGLGVVLRVIQMQTMKEFANRPELASTTVGIVDLQPDGDVLFCGGPQSPLIVTTKKGETLISNQTETSFLALSNNPPTIQHIHKDDLQSISCLGDAYLDALSKLLEDSATLNVLKKHPVGEKNGEDLEALIQSLTTPLRKARDKGMAMQATDTATVYTQLNLWATKALDHPNSLLSWFFQKLDELAAELDDATRFHLVA